MNRPTGKIKNININRTNKKLCIYYTSRLNMRKLHMCSLRIFNTLHESIPIFDFLIQTLRVYHSIMFSIRCAFKFPIDKAVNHLCCILQSRDIAI